MSRLKEENLKSYELLEQWANKDTQKAKSKKSKKSLDWSSFGTKNQISGGISGAIMPKLNLEKSFQQQQQRQPTSARFSQRNAVRPINTNNRFEQGVEAATTRENTIMKKSLDQQSSKTQKTVAIDTGNNQKQKDSINSTSSSVTSGSANNTITTTSSEASSSRSNSAGNPRPPATQTVVLETAAKKSSLRQGEKTSDATKKSSLNSQPSAPPPPAPPPATTINPAAASKTDYNLVTKKNSVSLIRLIC